MRLARDAGDISSLFPTGVHSLVDAPHVFVQALSQALYYLSFENLPEHERPPKAIWLDSDKMESFSAMVQENRAAGRHGFDLAGMPQNEHAKTLLAELQRRKR